jgi:LysM repeat protein
MSLRARIGLLVLVLAIGLAWFSLVASAQEGKPSITTPTPTPKPYVPAWLSLRQPENLGKVVFLPLLVTNTGGQDNNPDSFRYVVRSGDTLWSLALDFGRDLDTMSCVTRPTGNDAETLTPGSAITVPALTDLCYTVTPGDTLAAIAARNGLSVATIVRVAWNGFTSQPYVVVPRQRVLLPGVRTQAKPRADRRSVSQAKDPWAKSPWPDWRYGDGQFIWPVIGTISQYAHPGHWALDIAVPEGTQVKAADRGKVLVAGWNSTGYGFRVVIDHGNDYVTLYAHLSDIYVETGQVVGKGQVIGASGANGNVTGPHLHFEIRDFGALTDPLTLLPQR